ncbi:MAG: undecaprenyldiphospho-muramoylpentapeptide beta-N-acetylglucosaminyltransferase [Gammaproteobacteria bacterium]|nr:undecaprenyldiphospho-muramoylpentapeptide beta-N-acetylglucosaminyltransferase [Gammaproteobacteria bacterium]
MNAPRKVQRVLVTAGGTGGHVFPALAAAKMFQEQGVEVRWLGTAQGIEATVVPANNIAIDYLDVAGVRGQGLVRLLLAPLKIVRSVLRVMQLIRQHKPDAVLGMGGFVTGPTGIGAWLAGCPLFIHEQNAIAGFTNRVLAKFAKRVFQAFPATFAASPKVETTGNPVRKEIAAIEAPDTRYEQHTGSIRFLILGGSQGAVALNEMVPQALAQLKGKLDFVVKHQAGAKNIKTAERFYKEANVNAEVIPFIDDMAAAYGWADAVICRSGALTVSELAAAGVAALLVPYPHAVDDHQTRNGEYLSSNGAAKLVQQKDMTTESLADLLLQSFADRQQLKQMAVKARALAMTDATRKVVQQCLEVASGK